jgi:hypothetical protein
VKLAVLPLVKKDGMPEKAREIIDDLKFHFNCQYEEKDSIGKRYRRQDAIGTPYCVTVDGDTLKSDLPFFGRAYSIPYGGGKGLRFKAPITNYTVDSSHRNRHIIYIHAVDTEDSYNYIITLFNGGNAAVSVTPRQRSHIEFTGRFHEDER